MLKREVVARGVDELHSPLGQRVAVLIPCLNEEATIPKVVADFRAVLPEATIYVYDNNSTDRTIDMARRRRRGGAARGASRQGQCRSPNVCRRQGRHLRSGRWRRDL